MTTEISPQGAVRNVLSAARDRSVRVSPALAALVAQKAMEGPVSRSEVEQLVAGYKVYPSSGRDRLIQAIFEVMEGIIVVASETGALVPMQAIDSFQKAGDVDASSVAPILERMASFAEDTVKRFIVDILGLPRVPKDWGGEADDIYSSHVHVEGRQTAASFALKGRSIRGRLRLKEMGKNGDQLVRLTDQPAELFVVQHVDEVAPAVRRALHLHVTALRETGNPHAVGSVWDGQDCARLFVAYGYIEIEDGALTSLGRRLLDVT